MRVLDDAVIHWVAGYEHVPVQDVTEPVIASCTPGEGEVDLDDLCIKINYRLEGLRRTIWLHEMEVVRFFMAALTDTEGGLSDVG